MTGLHNNRISAREWIGYTNAGGIKSTAGRYGGTYAHKGIAFESGMWISAEFKLYLIREFQRLKKDENKRLQIEWNLQRTPARIDYRIHTDVIKENLIPPEVPGKQMSLAYATNADLLNVALFGFSASDRLIISFTSLRSEVSAPDFYLYANPGPAWLPV